MRAVRAAVAVAAMTAGMVQMASVGDAQVPPPTFDITPTSGPVGTTVSYSGEDCPNPFSDTIRVYFSSTSTPGWSGVVDSTTADGEGAFSGSFVVPDSVGVDPMGDPIPTEPGEHKVIVDCSEFAYGDESMVTWFTVTGSTATTVPATTTTIAATTTTSAAAGGGTTSTTQGFTPPAQPPTDAEPMSSAPATVGAGGSLPINESGFGPGETVVAVLYSTPQVLGTLTADSAGVLTGTLTIPASTAPGSHTLVLFGETTVKSATLTVQAAQPAPTLPRTGTADWMPVAVVAATLLLLAGAQLVGRSRRLAPAHRRR